MAQAFDSAPGRFLGVRTGVLATVPSGLEIPAWQRAHAAVPLSFRRVLSSLDHASGWLNSAPLKATDLQGKVVLIGLWTYTCINWVRTAPYVQAWAEQYREQGLVVIGVHAPEFPFEHDLDNVRRAVKDLRVDYPVAIDHNFAIWQSFRNPYWPALYFVDAKGWVRHHHYGEGEYERSERMIQRLLLEAGRGRTGQKRISVHTQGVEAAADWSILRLLVGSS
jgi:thiol-disulfide isomerase/thioredoxin